MSAMSHLLVVDDEPKLSKTLAMIFHGAGYKTTAVGDARTALSMLTDIDYDLVVMDWQLPDMDGESLLQEIRQTYPKLPVVVVTGSESRETLDIVMRLGARHFLLKPFDPKVIVSLVNDILRKDRVLRQGNEFFKDIQGRYTRL